MLQNDSQGVCIHGFGTFTFSQRKVDMGVGKVLLIQRPVFVMAENFIQIHLLTYPRQHATGKYSAVRKLSCVIITRSNPCSCIELHCFMQWDFL